MNPIRKRVSERLKLARTARGFTIQKMADTLGMTRQGYARWETGAGDIYTDQLMQVSEILGVDWELFYSPDESGLVALAKANELASLVRDLSGTGHLPPELLSQIESHLGRTLNKPLDSCENAVSEVVCSAHEVSWDLGGEPLTAPNCFELPGLFADPEIPSKYKDSQTC
jgi:transcriptional regulator with XRE-family HTH domain